MDDLIRVLLIPRTSSPVELFVNVPLKEIEFFPRSSSIMEICGSSFISSDDSSLFLFGAPFQHVEDTTRVGVNDQLTPLFTDLVPIGNYLLVAAEGHLPEAITVDSLHGKFKQSECKYIADHGLLDGIIFPVSQADGQQSEESTDFVERYLNDLTPAISLGQMQPSAEERARASAAIDFRLTIIEKRERLLYNAIFIPHQNNNPYIPDIGKPLSPQERADLKRVSAAARAAPL